MTYTISSQRHSRLGPWGSPFVSSRGSCLRRALDWSTVVYWVWPHFTLSVCQAPGTTAGDWLQTFRLGLQVYSSDSSIMDLQILQTICCSLITSASPHRGFETPRASDKQRPSKTCFTSSSWSISLPLAITSEPHYATLDREFSQGFVWPPWHSSHGMMPLATLFQTPNLQVWMFLRLSTSSFGAEWEEE